MGKAPHVSKPIALSFFSGALGLDLGLEQAGWETKLVCEFDSACRKTIRINRPHLPLLGDVNELNAAAVREAAGLDPNAEIDMVVGGPPCQAFSTAGKRQAFQDNRGNVFLKYIELALELRPKFLMIENVRGLLSCPMQHRPHHLRGAGHSDLSLDELPGGALHFVVSLLRAAGYGISFTLYNSANFGTPQIRERVVILAARDGTKPPYLVPTHSEDGRNLPVWRTFREAVFGLTTHHFTKFPDKRLRFFRMLSEGQNWRDLPVEVQAEAMGQSLHAGGGKTGFFRRLAWDKPAPTLVTHPAMPATDLAHPSEDRPLSVEEYKRVQDFPDDYTIEGSLADQYKQLGNAVPVSLGRAVGNLVLSLIRNQVITRVSEPFKYSRYRNTSDIEWQREFDKQIRLANRKQPSLF